MSFLDFSLYSTLVDLLRWRASEHGDRLVYRFLVTGDVDGPIEEWTYADLDFRARAVAVQLREAAAFDQRVLLLYAPGLDFIAGFLGCLYAGAVAVPTYPPDPARLERTLPRLRGIIRDSGARFVLTTGAIATMAEALFTEAPELRGLAWLASDDPRADMASAYRQPEIRRDSLAFLQYTSGSTGEPKGVMITHDNVLHNERLIAQAFGHRPDLVGVGWLPLFHDMGLIGNVLQVLYLGVGCTLMSPLHFLQKPVRWLRAISHYRATTSGGPNFAYDLCVRKVTGLDRASLDLRSWTTAFNGAEPVRRATLDRFAEAFEPVGFRRSAYLPCYGLAEATLLVSAVTAVTGGHIGLSAHDAHGETLVSSGRWADDHRVLVVHPEARTVCAPREVGEIWVAGPSVAGGYWNRPEESAETFHGYLADAAGAGAGPFLRTGDLGFLAGDELYVTGRLKDLVIVRGQNHYPQDIEATAEGAHPSVRPGCSAAFSIEAHGEEWLVVVAEVERGGSAEIAEAIREAVAAEHGITAREVVLLVPRSIPKTSSGKIQRRACRAGFLAGSLEVVARARVGDVVAAGGPAELAIGDALDAAGTVEERVALATRWVQEVVAGAAGGVVERASAQGSEGSATFAGLGLDSLALVELQEQFESALDIALPAAFLWQHPTVSEAAAALVAAWERGRRDGRVEHSADPSSPQPAAAETPHALLSSGQLRLWFLDRLEPGVPLYNVAFGVRMEGALDPALLARSLNAIVARHTSLRTVFRDELGQPQQLTLPELVLDLPRIDLSGSSSDQPDRLERLSLELARQPFDLSEGPRTRAALIALGEREHVLLIVQHHIITDGWSIGVLLRELAATYGSLARGTGLPSLPPARLAYADYARWQRSRAPHLDAARAYWVGQLDGLPRLELPTDRVALDRPAHEGGAVSFALSRETTDALRALSQREGVTLFATLMSAYAVLLHAYSGQDDFGVGTIVANRDRPELRGLIGFLANTLVLRCDLAGAPSFRELLGRMRTTVRGALTHAELPFDEVATIARAARGGDDNPLFRASFVLEDLPSPELAIPGLAWTPVLQKLDGSVPGTAKFDLSLLMATSPEGMAGTFEFRSGWFDPGTIERMALHFQTLLAAIVAEPATKIGALPLLTETERQQMLVAWNEPRAATGPLPAPDACIHELFEAQVERTPEAVAAVFEDESLTYAALNARANRLAHRLRALGVGPEARVCVQLERSLDVLAALLGVLKAGGAYVPLDPKYPAQRRAYVLEDAGASVLVDGPAWFEGGDGRGPVSDANPAPLACADHLAYVIYTSGSTGAPKGVMVQHRSVVAFFAAMDALMGAEAYQGQASWLAGTSISFDISVLELLWSLTRGFKVVIQDDSAAPTRPQPARARPAKALDMGLFYFADDEGDEDNEKERSEDRYRLLLEGAKFADRHGFSAVWTPERHFHAFGGLYPNPSLTSAAVAAVTERIGIRAGSVVLPLHHPVRVAEEWAVVDNLSRGRVGVSFAAGWHANDFVFAPERYADRKALMLEGIETVRRLWRGETVSYPGGAGKPVEVRLRPRPVQRELPIWLTAAGTPDTFKAAGRLGAGVLTHLLGQSLEDLRDKIALYRAARREAGHEGEGCVTLMIHTFVAPDARFVREKVEGPFRNYLKSSIDLMRGLGKTLGLDIDSASFSAQDLDLLAARAFERYFETSGLFGTPESCREMLARAADAGVDELGCLIDFGVDTDSVLASLPYLDQVRRDEVRRARRAGRDDSVAAQIERHGITHFQCTPSLARVLLLSPEAPRALSTLQRWLVGGEALPVALAEQLRAIVPDGLINMYGPTETTVWSSSHRPDGDLAGPTVSIGKPIANTQLYVLDAYQKPVPVGVAGELYIAGRGVVRGYLGRPGLTAERFVPHPFGEPGARMYRTGDRARWRADGTVEFLGRVDHQVKLRGHRVEPGEIEAALAEHPAVRESVVVVREDVPGDQRLVAYLVARPGASIEPAEVKTLLGQRLPEHMVPSRFVTLEAMPLLPNGKLDRRALPVPDALPGGGEARSYVAPQGQIEQKLAVIWQTVLRVERVGVHDNFFDIGGHSLLMAQVHAQLQAAFPQKVPLVKLLEHPTIHALAQYLGSADGAKPSFEASHERAKNQIESLRLARQRAAKKETRRA